MASMVVSSDARSMANMTASAVRHGETLRHEVDVNGRHILVTDEPESIGGTDNGPAPHELLPAALASCVATTVALYAQRRGWEIGAIRCDVDYDPMAEPRRMDVTLHLPESLSYNQLVRLRRVAESCPVRRALEAGFVVGEHLEADVLAA
jgi:putative redox protein